MVSFLIGNTGDGTVPEQEMTVSLYTGSGDDPVASSGTAEESIDAGEPRDVQVTFTAGDLDGDVALAHVTRYRIVLE